MIRKICVLVFSMFMILSTQAQGLFDALFVDINGKGSFPELSNMTICGDQDTLALAITAIEDTVILQGITLGTTLPSGYEFSGYGKIFRLPLDSLDAHPGAPVTDFLVPLTQVINPSGSSYNFTIGSSLNPNEVFVVYLGVKARCGVNLLGGDLFVNYNLNYQRFPCLSCPGTTGGWTPTYETYSGKNTVALNNNTYRPVLVVQSQGTIPTVSIGGTVHRRVVINQTGQLAYLDSIYYRDIASTAVNIVPGSVMVNGITVASPNITASGMQFPIKASVYDLTGRFEEQDSIIVEYDLLATCPVGQNTSIVRATWGCAPSGTCQTANANYSYIVDLGATITLSSNETSVPYSCSADTGLFVYTQTNASTYGAGLDTNAGINSIMLGFDTRGCGLFTYDRFFVEYAGQTVQVTPTSTVGTTLNFNISAAINSIAPGTNGVLPATGNSAYKFYAYYKSACTTSCTVNCNDCRKPYVTTTYKDKCAKSYTAQYHKLGVGLDGMKNLGLIPCLNIGIELASESQVGICDNGHMEYNVDLTALNDTVGGFKFSLNTHGCNFYTITEAFVNGVSVPFTVSGGIATVDLTSNAITIPGFYDNINADKIIFDLSIAENNSKIYKNVYANLCVPCRDFQNGQTESIKPNTKLANSEVEDFNEKIKIYPNPASSYINIDFANDEIINNIKEIEILDVNGRKVLSENIKSINNIIYTNNIANGIYIINVIDKENFKLFNKKIVVIN